MSINQSNLQKGRGATWLGRYVTYKRGYVKALEAEGYSAATEKQYQLERKTNSKP